MLRATQTRLCAARQSFDAIVVGAGTAGCLIAGRLSMENLNVLVLEEGPDVRKQPPWHWQLPSSPLAHRAARRGYERVVTTPPQVDPLGGAAAEVQIPVPRVLGGSGVMGSRAWNLGDARDWEGGAWDFREELLPRLRAFESTEDLHPHRGRRGKFTVSRPPNFSPLFKPVCEAISQDAALLGEFTRPDFTVVPGCGRPDLFVDPTTGLAHSTLQRYVLDMLKLRRPLTIRCDSRVIGIRPAGGGATAAGVTYTNAAGEMAEADAPLVVLSAGTVGTARVLLGSRGSVEVPAGVGAGYWDVPQVVLQFAVKNRDSHNCYFDKWVREFLRLDLAYMSPVVSLRSSYDDLVTYYSTTGGPEPDVAILFQPFTFNSDGTQPLGDEHGVQFLIRPLRPKSRGVVAADGTVDPKYFTEAAEREAVAKAAAYVRDTLVRRASLVPIVGAATATRLESSGLSGGTTAAAVDPATFVLKGTTNVYVCDGSIIERPPTGGLLPYHVILADMCADKILNKQSVRAKTDTQNSGSARIVY